MPIHYLKSQAHEKVPHAIAHAVLMSVVAACFAVLVSPTMLLLQQLEFNAQLTEYDVRNGMYNAYYSDDVAWTDEQVGEQTFDYDLYRAAIEYEITVRKSVATQQFESLGIDESLYPVAEPEQESMVYPVRVMVATDFDNQIIASYQSPTGNQSVSGPNPSIITYQQLTGVNLSEGITEQQAIEAGVIVPDPANLLDFSLDTSIVYESEDETVDPLIQKLQAARDAQAALQEIKTKKANLELAMTNHINIGGAKVRNSQKAYQSAEQNLVAIQSADASAFGGEAQYSAVQNGADAAVKAAQKNLVLQNGKFNDKVNELSTAIAALEAAQAVAEENLATARAVLAALSGASSSYNTSSSLRSSGPECEDSLLCSTSSSESSLSSPSYDCATDMCGQYSSPSGDYNSCIANWCAEDNA